MAAGDLTHFTSFKTALLANTIDVVNDTIVAVLVTASYTPSAAHSTWADVSAYQASGTGYTAGGKVLASPTLGVSGGDATFTAGGGTQPVWTTTTITAKYLVLVVRAGASLVSGDALVGYVDLSSGGGSVSSTAGTFSATWAAQLLTLG